MLLHGFFQDSVVLRQELAPRIRGPDHGAVPGQVVGPEKVVAVQDLLVESHDVEGNAPGLEQGDEVEQVRLRAQVLGEFGCILRPDEVAVRVKPLVADDQEDPVGPSAGIGCFLIVR